MPDGKILCVLENLAPLPDELTPVALGARAPHGRSFRAVEHTELNGRCVRHLARVTAQRVNLADYLPFGNSADGRIAAHLGDFVHVHRNETRLRAQLGCGTCCFASSMARTNDYDIIFELHLYFIIGSYNEELRWGVKIGSYDGSIALVAAFNRQRVTAHHKSPS